MLDVPIYGRIATMELFRPHVSYFPVPSLVMLYSSYFYKIFLDFVSSAQNETQDFLFIATERYKFCVLQWDAEKSELLTRFGHCTLLVSLSQVPCFVVDRTKSVLLSNNVFFEAMVLPIFFSGNNDVFLISRAMGDVSDRIGRPTDNGQVWTYL
jgi:hypothetical protein